MERIRLVLVSLALLLVSAGVASAQLPDLSITKSDGGATFVQGGTGVYTIMVSNGALALPTSPSTFVFVNDTLPTGLTATQFGGTGWACTMSPLRCSRSDVLQPNHSYEPITLSVSVAADAPSSVTNRVTVSGGGTDANLLNNSDSEETPVVSGVDLTIDKSHSGNFTKSQNGTYSIIVTNSGRGNSSGTITVSDTLPSGLTPTNASGPGWGCDIASQTVTCTRNATVTDGSQTPTITLAVSVASTAPLSVINTVAVSGGGEPASANGNNSDSDPTTIVNPQPSISGIDPSSRTAGSGGFTLTVNGRNFVGGEGPSVVQWNGTSIPTEFVSATELRATVNSASVAEAGTATVTVFNPTTGGGGGTSNGQTFTINNPVPSISSLSPSATTAGLGQFTLTVNGSDFISASVIRWDGSNRTTTFVSRSQLTATITQGDIAAQGNFPITVFNPTPGGGTSAPATFTVNPPVNITTTSMPAGTLNVLYSQTLSATGGTGAITWSVPPGTLPPGLTLNGSQISGTPTGVGSFSFTVTATDSQGASDDQALTIEINNPAPSVLSLSPASAVAGGPAFTLTVNGPGNSGSFVPTSVVRWNGEDLTTTFVSATTLTASVSADRIALAGTASVSVNTPGPGGGTSNAVSFTITNPTDLSITNVIPGTAIAGSGTLQITVLGNRFVPNSAVRWIGQAVPATFISPTEITATINAALLANAGTAAITVVNPPPGGGTSNIFTFIINNPLPVLSSISPDGKSAGQAAFTLTLTGSNFISSSQVSWNGLGLTSTFVSSTELRATVPANLIANPGTASVTVENPEPGGGISAARTFTIGDQLTITTETPLPSGTIGLPYSRTINAVGGDPPYRWGLAVGSQLPAGLALNPNSGVLSGTPTEIGTYSVNIQVTDSLNVVGNKAFVLTISPATFLITTASPLPNAQLGAAYTQTFAASGGTAPYVNWSVTGGQLPGGLTLNTANGTLSGTPNAVGNFTFTITVTDNASETASKEFTLSVPPPGNVLTILTTSCPAGSVGAPYNCSFTASGGVPAYTWAITAGTLPAGLALNNTSGVISGTPQSVGEANLTMTVTDAVTATDTQTFTINVTAATVTISLLGTAGPAQQNQVTLTLPQALSTPVTGQVTLSFTPDPALPNGGAGLDDPAIQFSSGGRTASFTVPAGSTEAAFTGGNLMLQTGTIAGTVTVTLTRMQSGSSVITPSPAPAQSVVVARLAPVISSVRIVNRTAAGFSVEVTGYATPRDLTQAGFQFTGQNLQGAQATIQLGPVAQTWYASEASLAFGSQFTYAQSFTTSADPAGITSVSVTLTNSLGNSAAASANF